MTETIVFITGASAGLGRALAETVPFTAPRVVDLSRSGLPGVAHVPADLATPGGWDRAAAAFERELAGFEGKLAVLVHNAGTLDPIGFAGEVDPAAYRRLVLLDSAAPQILGDAFLRALRLTSARGLVIMVSSGAANRPYEGWSGYCAGKAAVDHWVQTVGREQDERGGRCRVVAIAPGVVETDMQSQIRRTRREDFPEVEKFVQLHETGALREPVDAARDVWAVASRDLPNGSVVDVRSA
jgi:benzil reductase ((S)-benzoin forming)